MSSGHPLVALKTPRVRQGYFLALSLAGFFGAIPLLGVNTLELASGILGFVGEN
jgi:hypothetical protein